MSAQSTRKSALQTMSQLRRRVLVIMMQLGLVVSMLMLAFASKASWWLVALLFFFQTIYLVIHFRITRPVASEISDRKVEDLDERQLAVRDRAYHRAYQILMIIVIIFATAPMIFVYLGVAPPLKLAYWHILGLSLFFMNLSISLPASVVAWTEPDPEPEIEEKDHRELERGEV